MNYPPRNESLGVDEFIVGNRIYDISTFKKVKFSIALLEINLQIHPGGSIISFFVGADATNPFNEFHYRSEKARKTLATLPSRPLDEAKEPKEQESALLRDFAALRTQLEKVALLFLYCCVSSYLVLYHLSSFFSLPSPSHRQEGYFDPSPLHIFLRLLELLVLHAIGLYLMACTHWRYLGIAIFSIANGTMMMMMMMMMMRERERERERERRYC
jgi:hypothetical protein